MSPSLSHACVVLLAALGCVPSASGFGLMPLAHNNKGVAAAGSFVQASAGRVLPRHTARPQGVVLMAADDGDGKKDAKAAREVSRRFRHRPSSFRLLCLVYFLPACAS